MIRHDSRLHLQCPLKPWHSDRILLPLQPRVWGQEPLLLLLLLAWPFPVPESFQHLHQLQILFTYESCRWTAVWEHLAGPNPACHPSRNICWNARCRVLFRSGLGLRTLSQRCVRQLTVWCAGLPSIICAPILRIKHLLNLRFFFFFFVVQGAEATVSCIPGKCFTTELYQVLFLLIFV